jgi:hypothetical protein
VNKEQIAEILLNIISKQSFASWHESEFEDYIQGDENAPTRARILSELQRLVSHEIR